MREKKLEADQLQAMVKVLALATALVACSSRGKDWSTVAVDDTIESSVNHVNFEIHLPKGWKLDVNDDFLKGWHPDVEKFHSEPSVTVGYVQQAPTDLDAYIQKLTFEGGTPIVSKKLMTGSWLVVVTHTGDNGIMKVDYVTHMGDTYLGCSAFQMRKGGVPNPTATAEWLENVCRSLTIK